MRFFTLDFSLVYLMLRKQFSDANSQLGERRVAPQRYRPSRKRVACQGNRPSVFGKLSQPPRYGRVPHNWLAQVTLTNLQSNVRTCRLKMEWLSCGLLLIFVIEEIRWGSTFEEFHKNPFGGTIVVIGVSFKPAKRSCVRLGLNFKNAISWGK